MGTPKSQKPMSYAAAKSLSVQRVQRPATEDREMTDGLQTMSVGTMKRAAFDPKMIATSDGLQSFNVFSQTCPADADSPSALRTSKRTRNFALPDGSKTWCLGSGMVAGSEVEKKDL